MDKKMLIRKNKFPSMNRALIKRQRNYQQPAISDHLEIGDAVIVNGCVGMLMDIQNFQAFISFGADGPMYSYSYKIIERATLSEVKKQGLYGVGFKRYATERNT